MKTLRNCLLVVLSAVLVLTSCSKDDDKVVANKEGILLVTFGSSYPEPQKTFTNIDTEVKKAVPATEVRWAYTSHIIRNILLKKGMDIDSPEEALKKMKADGYAKITVQSLHVIPGAEYNDLIATIDAFKKANPSIKVSLGTPLMTSEDDMSTLADKLAEEFAAIKNNADEALVFMGHGTHHEANNRYSQFQTIISAKAPNFFVGTVEANPDLNDVIALLEKAGIKTVTLTPLMSVAGDHANNDMAGTEEDSWKTILEAKGYTVKVVLKGLGDYNSVNSIWVNHLKTAKAAL